MDYAISGKAMKFYSRLFTSLARLAHTRDAASFVACSTHWKVRNVGAHGEKILLRKNRAREQCTMSLAHASSFLRSPQSARLAKAVIMGEYTHGIPIRMMWPVWTSSH